MVEKFETQIWFGFFSLDVQRALDVCLWLLPQQCLLFCSFAVYTILFNIFFYWCLFYERERERGRKKASIKLNGCYHHRSCWCTFNAAGHISYAMLFGSRSIWICWKFLTVRLYFMHLWTFTAFFVASFTMIEALNWICTIWSKTNNNNNKKSYNRSDRFNESHTH